MKIVHLFVCFLLSILLIACRIYNNPVDPEIIGTVATPIIAAESGIYTHEIYVRISCETIGALILYTVDGTTPNVSTGTVYLGAVTISSTTTLKAIAVKSGMKDSPLATGEYTIVKTTSTCTVTYNGNGNTSGTPPIDPNTYAYNGDVTVLGNSGNLAKTDCSFSGWNTFSSGNGTTYQQGDVIRLQSTDIILYAKWTNLASLPYPKNLHIIRTVDTSGSANWVHVSGNYAFVADGDSGLQIIDITNPAIASIVSTKVTNGSANGVYVDGNYAFVANGSTGLKIIDISTPTNATVKRTVDTSGTANRVHISGNYAYVAVEGIGMKIIDISNPTVATVINTIHADYGTHGVFASGNYAYLTAVALAIIDVTDPFAASTSTVAPTAEFGGGSWTYGIYVNENYAYVTVLSLGLKILDVSTPANAAIINVIDTGGDANEVFVSGNYAYVANYRANEGGSNIKIIDTSNPQDISIVHTVNTIGGASGMFVVGHYVYVADGTNGLVIIGE